MSDMQFLQIQLKLDFHWLSSGKMCTKQNFKISSVAVQQTAAHPGVGGGGTIISDHLSRVWLLHWGKCWSCLPVRPPARQSPSRLLLLGRLRASEQTNPLWSPCWQTTDGLSLERDINLKSPASKKSGSFFLFSSLCDSHWNRTTAVLPPEAFFHVKPSTRLCSVSTAVFPFDTCHLWPLCLSWPSSSESDVGPRGGTWGLAAVGCRCNRGSVNKRPLAVHF